MTSCASNIKQSQCDSTVSHTILENKEFQVFIYYPNSISKPDIWEGPICTQAKRLDTVCHFNESLIKSAQFTDLETLAIETFSGSNSQNWSLNLNSCKVKTF